MKKIFTILILLSFYAYADSIESFIEYNLDKNFTFSNNKKIQKDSLDLSLNFEFYSPPENNKLGGFGISQNSVKIKNYNSNEFNIGTYYLVKRLNLTKGKIQPYIKIQGGAYYPQTIFGKTEINSPEKISLENGWFCGGAIGLQYKSFLLQGLYKVYLGDATINSVKTKFDYSTTTISLGYNLGI